MVHEKDEQLKSRQKGNFDTGHKAKILLPLTPGEPVWVPDLETEGTVGEEVAPHSYKVTTVELNGLY